ncbi:uncharacterized protein [Misgurnus anguillicaudatus]|uniref:uncharacterized protein isoform X2 n=1 Tax=Misgurnus anguillicaudatus TaxID=75329 RepID=UPI003CCF6490
MKLIPIILTALVFINAANSAAIREGSEDLLRFLNDAFELNLPPDNLKPTMLTETTVENEKILYPAVTTAECKASELVSVVESFNITPKPNLAEITGNAEERSIESSNSDSGLTEKISVEDSRDVESSKRLQLRSKLTDSQSLQENIRNSEESASIDKTDMETEVMEGTNNHPNKAPVMMDVSSEEMDKPVENVWYRSLRAIKNYSAEMTGAPDRKELDPKIQSLALGRMNLKHQSGQPHETDKHQQHTYKREVDLDSPEVVDTSDNQYPDGASEELDGGRGRGQTIRLISDQSTLLSNNPSMKKANLNSGNSSWGTVDNSTEVAGQNPGCTETSVEHPRSENSSLDPPKVDPKFQKDTVSYQNQLRKLCPSKKVRTSNNPREQLDLDSPERAKSELLDNSIEEHVSLAV